MNCLDQVFRDEWGRVLAALIGFLGDFDLAEEAAQGSQRQRDLRLHRQGRMAAGEQELEPLVRDGRLVHLHLGGLGYVEELRLLGECAIAPDPVDRAVARGRDEPRPGVVGRALAGPALRCDRERLLRGFLGEIEVAEEADQGGEDASPLVAEDPLEDLYPSFSGRISTAPPSRAAGIRDASSIAASRSSASKKR